ELSAGFELGFFADGEFAHDAEVHGLHAGAVDGVAAHIAVSVCGRRSECGGVPPGARIARAMAEDGLAGIVGSVGVLTDDGPGVGRIAEYGDGDGPAALDLVFRRSHPVAGNGAGERVAVVRTRAPDRADCHAVADIAARA